MTAQDGRLAVLALEHEAVWLYGLVGGRFPAVADSARAAFADHRRERDRLHAALGSAAVGPAATYARVESDLDAARRRVQDIEGRIAAAWLRLVGEATGDRRAEAVERLTVAALAGADWGAAPVALPGLSG